MIARCNGCKKESEIENHQQFTKFRENHICGSVTLTNMRDKICKICQGLNESGKSCDICVP